MKQLLQFPILLFVKQVILPTILVTIVSIILPLWITTIIQPSLIRVLIIFVTATIWTTLCSLYLGLTKTERITIKNKIKTKLK